MEKYVLKYTLIAFHVGHHYGIESDWKNEGVEIKRVDCIV